MGESDGVPRFNGPGLAIRASAGERKWLDGRDESRRVKSRAAILYLVWALGVAIVHGAVFLGLLGEQIARAEHFEAPRYESGVLNFVVAVLGAPIFYLVPAEWTFWRRPYLGDDLWIIVLLAALNALCWGVAADWVGVVVAPANHGERSGR